MKIMQMFTLLLIFGGHLSAQSASKQETTGNPVFKGWYADPEAIIHSEGDWTGPDYCLAYAIADSPFGPFKRIAKILQQDPSIARGVVGMQVLK